MKAAILKTVKQPLQIEETAKPQLAAGHVLLRVRACGVCRTDLHIVEGELPQRKSPLIPGHQIVGDIVEG
ncbi:MAG: alcohol dehydrogenase catalytic domain-containing protein, partial [Candidatus Sulfotelmatobacter sp.]